MKSIFLGVDEFTIVILPDERFFFSEWESKAEKIIADIYDLLLLEDVFDGKRSLMTEKLPAGYTVAYDLGVKDFYFSAAYNADNPCMAVCVRFSAKAWAVYQARYFALYDEHIILPQILSLLDNNMANKTARLSKVDFVVDYFDCGIDLDELYRGLKNDVIVVHDQEGKSRIRTVNCFEGDRHVETIYLGSRKGNSRGYMRIYDKKKEQIETNGFRLKEALSCTDWIRFEAVFKGIYAHEITERILNSSMTSDAFARFIAFCIAAKYRLYDINAASYMDCSVQLVELIHGADFEDLRVESPRDNSLHQNIRHIEHGSGLFPTLYKIQHLYGADAVNEFLQHLLDQFKKGQWISRSMHAELTLWLEKHADLKNLTLKDNL